MALKTTGFTEMGLKTSEEKIEIRIIIKGLAIQVHRVIIFI